MSGYNGELIEACKSVFESIDVGGEQSRQFFTEIKLLREAIKKMKSLIKERKRLVAVCKEARSFIESLPFVADDMLPVRKELANNLKILITKSERRYNLKKEACNQ